MKKNDYKHKIFGMSTIATCGLCDLTIKQIVQFNIKECPQYKLTDKNINEFLANRINNMQNGINK